MDAEIFMNGPRGRRLALEFATLSERTNQPEYHAGSLMHAVMHASHDLDPGRGTSRKLVRMGGDGGDWPVIPPDEVARRIVATELAEVTAARLRDAMAQSVNSARYYQEPDGEDFLAITAPVRQALTRVANHITESPLTDWWTTSLALEDQWFVRWTDDPYMDGGESASETLLLWRHRVPINEDEAFRVRPNDPTANWTGEWWSIPPITLINSSRSLDDGTPAGLWYSEDTGGMEWATARQLKFPGTVRMLDIDGATTWAELCRRYPLEVTAQKRHDWYRSTGRDGRWLVPDWSMVARDFEGVHLTVAGYLAASGTVIQVDDEFASTIAGWNPDQTWWLTDRVELGESHVWRRTYDMSTSVWSREQ